MKLALFTVYSPAWLDLVKATIPNWMAYCSHAGYDLIVHPKPAKTERFYGWLRIEDLYDLLIQHRDYEAIVLLDADLIFTNFEKRFEDLMRDGVDFYITQDVNGFNAGVTIWRRTEGVFRFIDVLLRDKDKFTGDQDAIAHNFVNAPCFTAIVPQSEMNSYLYDRYPEGKERVGGEGDWKRGDFILHLPALPLSDRIETFNDVIH